MKPEIKMYYVIPFIFFLILIVVSVVLTAMKKPAVIKITPTSAPLPTQYQGNPDEPEATPKQNVVNPLVSPTLMPAVFSLMGGVFRLP